VETLEVRIILVEGNKETVLASSSRSGDLRDRARVLGIPDVEARVRQLLCQRQFAEVMSSKAQRTI